MNPRKVLSLLFVLDWQRKVCAARIRCESNLYTGPSYREISLPALALLSMIEWITGTIKIATIPPAKPLL